MGVRLALIIAILAVPPMFSAPSRPSSSPYLSALSDLAAAPVMARRLHCGASTFCAASATSCVLKSCRRTEQGAGGTAGPVARGLLLAEESFVLSQLYGELCPSRVGDSAGNKLAGWSAGLTATVPLPTLFGSIAAVTIVAALLLLLLVRPIRALMGGVH